MYKENFRPSTNWVQAAEIMEKHMICVTGWDINTNLYTAETFKPYANHGVAKGKTQLIAAMRCFVRSKKGYEIDVPDKLLEACA